jgi:hypothetical protein
MPMFYRGAGPGTFWHVNDARLSGFMPQSPGTLASHNRLMLHIARGTVSSPYVSMTRSYGVAWEYAVTCGRTTALASSADPGFVYEIELDDPLPRGLTLLDPIKEIANNVPGPLASMSYQHDGTPDFLLGVIRPAATSARKKRSLFFKQPPPATGTPRPPNLSGELETLVRALRDAEILALGAIPAACIRNRFSVY